MLTDTIKIMVFDLSIVENKSWNMSRTYKDRPYKILELIATRKGCWYYAPLRVGRAPSRLWVPAYTKAFLKDDTQSIREFQELLESESIEYTIENIPNFEREDGSYTPKEVEFVYRFNRYVTWSTYLTDPENYDVHTKTDKRDGGKATGFPDVQSDRMWKEKGKFHFREHEYVYMDTKKTSRHAKLNQIRKFYNSGYSVDEIDMMEESCHNDLIDGFEYAWNDCD